MKFVSSLTPAEKITLQEAAKKHPSYRTRQRCEALLLSHKGSTIVQLCEVFGISRNTAGIWINNWETKGFVGLLDGKRDVHLLYLPKYSPELNLIEILWRKIKYEWLPLQAFSSYCEIKKHVSDILGQYGSKEFTITFA